MRRICVFAPLLAVLAACASAPVTEVPQAASEWYRDGQAALAETLARPPTGQRARNIILFIGDGMDIPTITAARILEGQKRGEPGEENALAFEAFPFTGLAKTYNTNQQTPDSAGTATAMLSGVKTRAGVVGLSEEVRRGDCASARGRELISIVDLAEDAGLATGIVTTTRITHATPAAAYAHAAEREWEGDSSLPLAASGCKDIARQLVEYSHGDGIDVVFGGGRRYFMPADHSDPEYPDRRGHRSDGQDLIARWQQAAGASGRFVWNRAGFDALQANPPARVLGLFELSHMRYEIERESDPSGEPSLAEMTATAITMLARDPDGFFLLVEGGRIDHAHHDGNAYRALTESLALSDAVRQASAMTSSRDTLIIVTADHGHTMRIVGYPTRGNPILGMVVENDPSGEPRGEPARDLLGLPYTTLGYINGPGFQGASQSQPAGPKHYPHAQSAAAPHPRGRADLSAVNTADPDHLQEAGIPTHGNDLSGAPTGSETHSAGDVPIYASGPGAHLLTGVHEQNYIFHVMRYVTSL